MITLPNFYGEKTVHIIGHYFVCGLIVLPLAVAASYFTKIDNITDTSDGSLMARIVPSQAHVNALQQAIEAQPQLCGDNEDWLACANSDNICIVKAVAEQGKALDILVKHSDWSIRALVAEHGYGLAQLMMDEALEVRKAATTSMKLQKAQMA